MATTPQFILDLPDDYAHKAGVHSTVVRALLADRDSALDLDTYASLFDLDGEAADALEERIAIHAKFEETWDDGDGRDGLHVVHFDGKPVAIVREQGYDQYNHAIAVIDLAALDALADAVRGLRKNTLQKVTETALDADVHVLLDLKDVEAAPTP